MLVQKNSLFAIFIALALGTCSVLLADTKTDNNRYRNLLVDIKKEALQNDSEYMSTHKEEAVTQEVLTPTPKIPKRTPDKFVRLLVYPFVNQDGVYRGASVEIFKYKDGNFITQAEDETVFEEKQIESKYGIEGAR